MQRALAVAHEVAFLVSRYAVTQNQIMHSAADIDRIDLDVAVVCERGAYISVRFAEAERAKQKAPGGGWGDMERGGHEGRPLSATSRKKQGAPLLRKNRRTISFSRARPAPNNPEMLRVATSPAARRLCALALVGVLCVSRIDAITLAELLSDPKQTPKRFASHFEKFEYEFHAAVQPADVFLANRAGDCDDYAILADYVLKRKNFTTRLVRVSLVGRVAHDVCYVFQSKAYLDYNNRKFGSPLEGSGRRLRQIANEVADSFEANWTSASEYTYDYETDKKILALTVVKTDPPARDPDA